jgi:hypothetical protein
MIIMLPKKFITKLSKTSSGPGVTILLCPSIGCDDFNEFSLGMKDMDAEEYLNQSVIEKPDLTETYRSASFSNRSLQTETPSVGKTASSDYEIIYLSTGLVAIAILGTLVLIAIVLRRLTFWKTLDSRLTSTKHERQASCERCRFFNNNPHLKCAVHPSKVLTSEAKNCSDYSPHSQK